MSDHYWMEKVAYARPAEYRTEAAQFGRSVNAEEPKRAVRRPAAASLVRVLRTFAGPFGSGRAALTAAPHGPRL